jgi:hypothetical protein
MTQQDTQMHDPEELCNWKNTLSQMLEINKHSIPDDPNLFRYYQNGGFYLRRNVTIKSVYSRESRTNKGEWELMVVFDGSAHCVFSDDGVLIRETMLRLIEEIENFRLNIA